MSTQWLCDHLGADSLVVLDASVLQVAGVDGSPFWLSGLDEYLISGHIPGAVFADLLEVFSDPDGEFGFARPSLAQFEAAAASVGVDNTSTVVVYDSAGGQWAARIWWLFRAFGYDNVSVLDGGLTKWNLEDRPTVTGYVEPRPTEFIAAERPELWVDKPFVESVVTGQADALLLCALSPREFAGERGNRARLGHIPGSMSVPSSRLVNRETNALLHPAALREIVAPALSARNPGQPIVIYCAGGIAAAADALALAVLGETRIAIYDGSLNEWVADPEAALA